MFDIKDCEFLLLQFFLNRFVQLTPVLNAIFAILCLKLKREVCIWVLARNRSILLVFGGGTLYIFTVVDKNYSGASVYIDKLMSTETLYFHRSYSRLYRGTHVTVSVFWLNPLIFSVCLLKNSSTPTSFIIINKSRSLGKLCTYRKYWIRKMDGWVKMECSFGISDSVLKH